MLVLALLVGLSITCWSCNASTNHFHYPIHTGVGLVLLVRLLCLLAEQESQVSQYAMGMKQMIFCARWVCLTKKRKTMKQTRHFVRRRNPIFERAKFNQRRKEEGEPADSFIMSLYCLAEHCAYGALHNEMIRNRIVVGLLDANLSMKLQMDPDLTLDKAVAMAR